MPLLYVPGNHDPSLRPPDTAWSPLHAESAQPGPAGCDNIDGRVVEVGGVRVAGLGGSVRYRPGANQYMQAQMHWRVLNIGIRVRLKRVRARRKLDVLVTHAPPFGISTAEDAAHIGFVAFDQLMRDLPPCSSSTATCTHGRAQPEREVHSTRIVNAVPSRLVEI